MSLCHYTSRRTFLLYCSQNSVTKFRPTLNLLKVHVLDTSMPFLSIYLFQGRDGLLGGGVTGSVQLHSILYMYFSLKPATQNVNVSDNNYYLFAIFNDLNNIPNSFPYCVYCVYTCTFFLYRLLHHPSWINIWLSGLC